LQGQADPLLGELAELLVGGQFQAHLFQVFTAYKLRLLFSLVDVVELVVRPVAAGRLRVFAPAAGFAADIVLRGHAAGPHGSQSLRLRLDRLIFPFDF
jgi:hypothetical protein